MDTSMENFVYWASPFVACCVDEYFEDITGARATVKEGINGIDFEAIKEPLVVGELDFECLEPVVDLVYGPELYSSIMTSNEPVRCLVKEFHI